MQHIKNIIFDFGNIFLNIDVSITEKAFIALGVSNFPSLYSLADASDLFEKLETGHISPDEFYDGFRLATQTKLQNEEIKNAWNALLLDYPAERLHWLNDIRNKYNIYLYSNTNKIHYDEFTQRFQPVNDIEKFNDYFIKAWYSHEIKMRKPYPESFSALLQSENLSADETLFVDDTSKNIEGARMAGLHTFHLPPPMTVFDLPL